MNQSIRSLLVPVHGGQLLLPSAVIAEITAYHPPEVVRDKPPPWFVGLIEWRQQRIPLIVWEKVLSLPVQTPTERFRTLVLYGLESPSVLPFYAIVTTDIPHVLSINEEQLVVVPEKRPAGLAFVVKVKQGEAEEVAWIADLVYLENLLRKIVG